MDKDKIIRMFMNAVYEGDMNLLVEIADTVYLMIQTECKIEQLDCALAEINHKLKQR